MCGRAPSLPPALPLLAGLVKDVVEAFPEVVVVGSKVCLQFLANLIFTPFKQQVGLVPLVWLLVCVFGWLVG